MLGSPRAMLRASKGVRDPYWASVTCLMLGQGANNGTVFTDSSPLANSYTRGGGLANIVTSTNRAKIGSSSIYGPAAVNGSYVGSSATNVGNFGTGDFCIEGFFYFTAAGTSGYACDFRNGGGAQTFAFLPNFAGAAKIGIASYTSGGTQNYFTQSTSTFPLNQWVHLAAVKTGNVVYMFIDGVKDATTQADSFSYSSNYTTLFANGWPIGNSSFEGNVHLRITKHARYSVSGFTPPTTFPTS